MTECASHPGKPALRSALRAQRRDFATQSLAIQPPARFMALLGAGGNIASYVPMHDEADPSLLAAAAQAHGYRIALPHVSGRAEPMQFLSWSPDAPLIAGAFGVLQPASDAPVVVPDIVLVPLLGFDSQLNRLGQGAGFYDRALAGLSGVLRIGVAWSIQRCDTLPVDPWDVPLDGVVTELGWIDPEIDA